MKGVNTEKDIKKVGIVTFFRNNYGSTLQSYALTRFLIDEGFDAYLIDHSDMSNPYNLIAKCHTIFQRFVCALFHPQAIGLMLKGKRVSLNSVTRQPHATAVAFASFEQQFQRIYNGNYTNRSEFDFFVTGSDQVWKLSVPGLHHLFFLRFTEKEKRVSYAASFGSDFVPSYNRRILRKYLLGMNHISVRETSGKEIVNISAGIRAEQVVDPVLLVGKEFWTSQFSSFHNSGIKDDYILCYFLDYSDWLEGKLVDFALQTNRKLYWVNAVYTPQNSLFELLNLGPLDFVHYIKNAKYVCTDSFHGTAFSILFEKQFSIFDRNYEVYPEQNSRIHSILDIFNLRDRFIGKQDAVNEDFIQYGSIADELSHQISRSRAYILGSLKY